MKVKDICRLAKVGAITKSEARSLGVPAAELTSLGDTKSILPPPTPGKRAKLTGVLRYFRLLGEVDVKYVGSMDITVKPQRLSPVPPGQYIFTCEGTPMVACRAVIDASERYKVYLTADRRIVIEGDGEE